MAGTRLSQEERNAIVMWSSPVKKGGHGLGPSKIVRKLKRVFGTIVTYHTPSAVETKKVTGASRDTDTRSSAGQPSVMSLLIIKYLII